MKVEIEYQDGKKEVIELNKEPIQVGGNIKSITALLAPEFTGIIDGGKNESN